ncbi:hypothetical protein EE612_053090 [Oryza sativa]|nr:hypothetical protein EE612_053090 [Oryza sativa]
MALDMAYAKAL